jgi:hypothetical protein
MLLLGLVGKALFLERSWAERVQAEHMAPAEHDPD